MADLKTILAKIEELERRCPGTHIHRDRLEDLAGNESMVCGRFKLDSPSTSGRIATFTVNLAELGQTMDEWLDAELPRHQPQEDDHFYNIFCSSCGRVQIGHSGYAHQLSFPDSSWICPQCGHTAEFDDETYGRDVLGL